jgi:acyl transferase domain-containing protein
MAGRFPGAKSVEEFWENLSAGVESITFFSDEELIEAGIPRTIINDSRYVKAAPLLDGIELFDSHFFGYSPREAQFIDPQHRLFLECAWHALEHAGYDADRYEGRIGVFGGAAMNTYLLFSGLLPHFISEYVLALTGSDKDFLATRVSYKLNLSGPSVAIQCACSTSLVALHFGCQSLLGGECDMALVGGVSVKVPQKSGYLHCEGDIFTPDGHCRAFDAKANGTIFGSGLGILVLKRLGDAIADGDSIHAVVKGTAINNDGSSKANYTAPSVERQSEAIVEAIANAGITADTISYIETHGTGTRLGDPIEIAALTRAFRSYTQENGFCAIGSLKTNVGHLDAAAGVAGVIKAVHALKHKQIPPSLNFDLPNPEIDFGNTPFYVNTALSEWKPLNGPRRAGVNSLGVGGTNAHCILEEAPILPGSGDSRQMHLLLISARTEAGLGEATDNLRDHLIDNPESNLADVAYTLQVGRKHFNHRRMVVCRDRDEAVAALDTLNPARVFTRNQKPVMREAAFMFPGQAAQHANMGLGLYKIESVFRENVDLCSEILLPHLPLDLRDILYPDEREIDRAAQTLNQTHITQPALFTIEYALAQLWISWGIKPQAFIGHSIGEYVAATLAGVFSLEDALSLVAYRGRLMQELPAGVMLAVHIPEAEIEPLLNGNLSLAAVNGPSLCVLSGEAVHVEELERQLSRRNLSGRRLSTSHAFHSAAVEPLLVEFTHQVSGIQLNEPDIPYLSNVTGTWIKACEATDPAYWARQMRQTVRFAEGIRELLQNPDRILLEVGPGHTLSWLAKLQAENSGHQVILASLERSHSAEQDIESLLSALGELWLAGAEIDWDRFYAGERRLRVPLPGYPFQRQRCWYEPAENPSVEHADLIDFSVRQDRRKASSTAARTDGEGRATSRPDRDRRSTRKQPVALNASYLAPRTPVEMIVAGVWQDELGVPSIGMRDNFFEMGGHSLLVTSVISRLNRMFKVDLPPLTIFESPTVADLAECIETIFQINRTRSAPADL